MANFAFIENEQISGIYDFLPQNWRNISNFHLIDDWNTLNELGWYQLEKVIPVFDSSTHKIDNPKHHFENGVAYETYDLIELPKPVVHEPNPWDLVIQERDKRIRNFQWRFMRYNSEIENNVEPTENIDAMNAYIDALNRVTEQEDPNNIVWPEYIEQQ